MFIQSFIKSNLQFHILQRILTSNHSQAVITVFSPIRILLETLKHQNRVKLTHVAWRKFIIAKQFIKNPETRLAHVSPGDQDRTAKRFLIWNPETIRNGMGRLAALMARKVVSGKFPKT